MKIVLVTLALSVLVGPAVAQNFSCSYGKRGACLDYGDQICSSTGKCVDSSAACFDTYQCNYEGFTCKSNVTECIEDHDALVRKYNILLADKNELADQYNELLSKANGVAESYDDLNDCLSYASTMDDVQTCTLYQ
ncbi:MAG: hypothetical protein ACSHWS_01795 [Sulfitobacter sp.]